MTSSASSFTDHVEAYARFLESVGAEMPQIRIEAHVESMRDWSQVGDLQSVQVWFEEQRRDCAMVVDDIPLNEARGWTIDEKTGNVSHDSGEFFTVHGVRVTQSTEREVGGWDQPILTQVGYDGGLLGILRKRIEGVPHYLDRGQS